MGKKRRIPLFLYPVLAVIVIIGFIVNVGDQKPQKNNRQQYKELQKRNINQPSLKMQINPPEEELTVKQYNVF